MAQGVLEAETILGDLQDWLEVDSAGTHGYHVGDPPDRRAQQIMRENGYAIDQQRSRQLTAEDFFHFDYILVMDRDNHLLAERLQPRDGKAKLHRFLEFSSRYRDQDVPDPYYGGGEGFAEVLDRVRDATQGFLRHLNQNSRR